MEILRTLINNYDIMFSINKIDKPNEINRIHEIPIDKLLVETDAKSDVVLHDIINKIFDVKKLVNMDNIIYKNTFKVLNNGTFAFVVWY